MSQHTMPTPTAVLTVRELPHVVELYDLMRQVKTTQLEEFLMEYAWGGVCPTVKWVDDNHALAVFSCREAAEGLLDSNQKSFKVRAYSKACAEAHLLPSEGEWALENTGLLLCCVVILSCMRL